MGEVCFFVFKINFTTHDLNIFQHKSEHPFFVFILGLGLVFPGLGIVFFHQVRKIKRPIRILNDLDMGLIKENF